MDRAVKFKGSPFARVNIWSPDQKLVYSSDHKLVGTNIEPSDELVETLDGNEPTTEILRASQPLKTEEDNRDILKTNGDLLEVYVPFKPDARHQPRGAFEVYLPYTPIAQTIRADTNRLYLILIVGLSLLYAIVFRVVARASRKLRTHGKEMSAHLERTKYESEHDPLTHLPNRTLFRSRAVDAIVAARRTGEQAALLLIDLDRFKEINDTLGHHSGDLLLQAIGPRLEQSCTRRHRRALRRRRVRHPAARDPRRGDGAGGGPQRSPDAASSRSRIAGSDAGCRRQHRHRAVPRPRPGLRGR